MDTILDVRLQTKEGDCPFIMPVSIHCHAACNLIVWKSLFQSDDTADWSEIKKTVARVMDRLADLLHDYQQFAPLVALVELQSVSAQWDQLMGDQDWHRGRFIMQGVKVYNGQNIDQVKTR